MSVYMCSHMYMYVFICACDYRDKAPQLGAILNYSVRGFSATEKGQRGVVPPTPTAAVATDVLKQGWFRYKACKALSYHTCTIQC